MPLHRGLFRLVASVMLALGLLTQAHAQAADKRKVIIDDDGFSMMQVILLRSPDVEVLGLTSVSGDVWANRATAMDLRGLEMLGRSDVPVAEGATYPLVNSEAQTDRWELLYGKLTWRGAWMHKWVEPTEQTQPTYYGPTDPVDLPYGNATHKALNETAAQFMVRMVHRYPGQVTIIACGPFTNLALAQRLDPQFARLAKGLVYMGGSLNPHQVIDNRAAADFAREFANSPRREFNFRFDPEAISIVSRSPWASITMVPVDPSTATQQSPAYLARLEAAAPLALKPWVHQLPPNFPLWDEIAAAVFLDPTLVTSHERLYVDADTQFGPGYGDTLSWREAYQPGLGEQPVDAVLTIDPQRLYAMGERLLAGK